MSPEDFLTDVAQCRKTLKLRRAETREMRRLGGITFYRNDLMVIKLTDAWVERRESRLDVKKSRICALLSSYTRTHTHTHGWHHFIPDKINLKEKVLCRKFK